jgi:hypothetical protein
MLGVVISIRVSLVLSCQWIDEWMYVFVCIFFICISIYI